MIDNLMIGLKITGLGMGIVFSIYVLSQKEKLCRQCKKAVFAIFSPQKAERTVELANLTNNIFAKFVIFKILVGF